MNSQGKERRDWSLVIFIIPIGILLLIIVGQIAIRIAPHWSVFANMRSNLDPNTTAPRPISFFQPILPQILTPMAWAESYLTPGGEISFPPFIIINPQTTTPTSAAPSPVPTTPGAPPVTGTTTNAVPPTPTSIIIIPSRTPTGAVPKDTATPPPPPPPTLTPPVPTNTPVTPSPTATPTGYPSTPPPYPSIPPPGDIGGTPDDIPGDVPPGSYTILDIGIIDTRIPDSNSEIIFYEYFNTVGNIVYLDQIIIGVIPDSDLSDGFDYYYQVLNWGDGNRDTNTTVDYQFLPDTNCPVGEPECDNREIPPGILIPTSDIDGTGILIDVDNAPSMPPPNLYYYIIIISPPGADPAQIDAITLTGL